MKFSYKKINPGVIRPIIPVTLQFKQFAPIKYEALVDSGADICVFPALLGEALGIPVRSGSPGPLSGVIGRAGKIYYHDILVDIGGNSTQVRAGFSYSNKIQCGFLGQKGIFSVYTVLFRYRKGIVELRPDAGVN